MNKPHTPCSRILGFLLLIMAFAADASQTSPSDTQSLRETQYIESLHLTLLSNGNIRMTIEGNTLDVSGISICKITATGVKYFSAVYDKGITKLDYSDTLCQKLRELNPRILNPEIRHVIPVARKQESPSIVKADENDDPAKRWEESKRKLREEMNAKRRK